MIQFKRVFVLLSVLMLGGCDLIDDILLSVPIQSSVISQGLDLDEHWQEIIPNPPLKVSKLEQEIVIKPPGNLNWWEYSGGYKPNKGPIVPPPNIEVQIVSEHGKIYPLNNIDSADAGGIGFSYWYKDDDPTHSHARGLPRDVVFTKVRIRSDKPEKTGEISWVCYG